MPAQPVLRAAVVAGLVFGAPQAKAQVATRDCPSILPNGHLQAGASRALMPEDLIRLRDIGPTGLGDFEMRLIAIAPDGERIAFQLRQADATRNRYCVAMIVADLRGRAAPIVVDQGGDLLRLVTESRANPAAPSGLPLPIAAQWSPDGRSIYFLKRTGGFIQVWQADAHGGGSKAVTEANFDIENFAIGDNGMELIIAGRPGIQRQQAAIGREGLTGFHYDDRYNPAASSQPFPARPLTTEAFVVALPTGKMRAAADDETRLLLERSANSGSTLAPLSSNKGWTLSFAVAQPLDAPLEARVAVKTDKGAVLTCAAEPCGGRIYRPFWNGDNVRYLRREAPVSSVTSVYEWTPGTPAPRKLLSTSDILVDCQPASGGILCLRESSLQPRRIELIDPATGRASVIFDPNPEFRQLRLGQVERLTWRNSLGLQTIGDLVYPVGYRPGSRYPLIIVQYDTRGFLRGGTGDEFPIQAFANRGYAVLSFNRPGSAARARGASKADDVNRGNLENFSDRRNVLSSLEIAIGMLDKRQVIDPRKIGITGLSDGGSTIEFGLVNSSLFAAAASSSCCWDPTTVARNGPASAQHFYDEGYPKISEYHPEFWNQISLVYNAARIRTPLLLQMADEEFISALPGFTALREHSRPVDLYIFPGEHHIKWQPAHKLAIYERSLDWFDYWLKGLRSKAPDRQKELAHWDELRLETSSKGGQSSPAAPSQ